MTSLWGSLAPAQPRGLFGSDDDWLLTRAINGLGFGPMTQATQAGRPNGYISNGPARPNDYMAPVAETISPTMGAYGAGQMVAEGSRAIGQGDYIGGGAGLALGMAGMIPGAPKKGIRAFHGSPHDFDRFDMSKIGTGEGAQAYGHGLYFAENEGVAKSYRDTLAMRPGGGASAAERIADRANAYAKGNVDEAVAHLSRVERHMRQNQSLYKDETADDAVAAIDILKGNKRTGRMYEVRINADPEDFLDWDKPLSQQSEKVRGVLGDQGTGQEAYYRNARRQRQGERTGNPLDDVLLDIPITDHTSAAAALRDAGIPGIRYLDQGSRGAGDGSRNYVVFDDALIEIMKKYGLFGSLGLGGASGLFGAAGEQSQ